MNGITKHQVRNLSLLATCQALMMTASTLNVAATALVGFMLADKTRPWRPCPSRCCGWRPP